MKQTSVQTILDRGVAVLVAKTGLTEAQARELILAQRAAAYVPPPVWRNAPRLTVAR